MDELRPPAIGRQRLHGGRWGNSSSKLDTSTFPCPVSFGYIVWQPAYLRRTGPSARVPTVFFKYAAKTVRVTAPCVPYLSPLHRFRGGQLALSCVLLRTEQQSLRFTPTSTLSPPATRSTPCQTVTLSIVGQVGGGGGGGGGGRWAAHGCVCVLFGGGGTR